MNNPRETRALLHSQYAKIMSDITLAQMNEVSELISRLLNQIHYGSKKSKNSGFEGMLAKIFIEYSDSFGSGREVGERIIGYKDLLSNLLGSKKISSIEMDSLIDIIMSDTEISNQILQFLVQNQQKFEYTLTSKQVDKIIDFIGEDGNGIGIYYEYSALIQWQKYYGYTLTPEQVDKMIDFICKVTSNFDFLLNLIQQQRFGYTLTTEQVDKMIDVICRNDSNFDNHVLLIQSQQKFVYTLTTKQIDRIIDSICEAEHCEPDIIKCLIQERELFGYELTPEQVDSLVNSMC